MMDPTQLPLRDIHLPEPVSWWPLAPGWWILMFVCVVALCLLSWQVKRRRAQSAARRHALRQLDALTREYEEHRDTVAFSQSVSALLRRTMLAYAPRSEIAGLTGERWLAWLDQGMSQPVFQTGAGRKLLEMPYRRPDDTLAAMEVRDVVAAVRQRLATPIEENV